MSERKGWIKLHKKSLDSGVFKNEKLWKFWTYCLLKAQFENKIGIIGYTEIPLSPGQFIFGRKKASVELGMSEQIVRSSLKSLVNMKNLTIKTTNKFSIITVCNWELYQGDEEEINQQLNQQITNKQPTNNHIKELKELNNISISRETIPAHEYAGRFSQESMDREKQVVKIIHYFNDIFSKSIKDDYPNRYFIADRLKDGATVEECENVILTKLLDPDFKPQWQTIETLFKKTNFVKYCNQSPADFGYVKVEEAQT